MSKKQETKKFPGVQTLEESKSKFNKSYLTKNASQYYMESAINPSFFEYKKLKASQRKQSINTGLAASLSRTINLGSVLAQNYKQSMLKKQRLQSRSVIDPDFKEEDLEKEPEIKLSKNLMFGLLACMLFINVGNFYSYDFPQLFESVLISKFNVDALKISFLYAIYSIPNFVFAPLLSIMLNHTGLGLGAIILSSMVFSG